MLYSTNSIYYYYCVLFNGGILSKDRFLSLDVLCLKPNWSSSGQTFSKESMVLCPTALKQTLTLSTLWTPTFKTLKKLIHQSKTTQMIEWRGGGKVATQIKTQWKIIALSTPRNLRTLHTQKKPFTFLRKHIAKNASRWGRKMRNWNAKKEENKNIKKWERCEMKSADALWNAL